MANTPASLNDFSLAVTMLERLTPDLRSRGIIPTPYAVAGALSGEEKEKFADTLTREIAEMLPAALLDERGTYLELSRLRHANTKDALDERAKLDLLCGSDWLRSFSRDMPKGYGFMSYPGFPFIESRALRIPNPGDFDRFLDLSFPVVYNLSGIGSDRKSIPGWLCFLQVQPSRLTSSVESTRRKVLQAAKLMEKLNAGLTGLGGLLAALTDKGKWLAEHSPTSVTTGHSYTVANILATLNSVLVRTSTSPSSIHMGIVGAAGSIGSGLSECCSRMDLASLTLFDKKDLTPLLRTLQEKAKTVISTGDFERDIPRMDVLLVATSSIGNLFRHDSLKPGVILIDDSQPKNISPALLKRRPDIVALEGGAVSVPPSIRPEYAPAMGGRLKEFSWHHIDNSFADTNDIPSCLAEVMIRTLSNETWDESALGQVTIGAVKKIQLKGLSAGFKHGEFQYSGIRRDI